MKNIDVIELNTKRYIINFANLVNEFGPELIGSYAKTMIFSAGIPLFIRM
jgi:hypothetical protein